MKKLMKGFALMGLNVRKCLTQRQTQNALMTKMAILLCSIVAFPMLADAEEETVGGYTWTFTVEGGYAKIGGDPNRTSVRPRPSGVVEIPSVLGGCIVNRIGQGALRNCSAITSIVIPDTVESIEYWAFAWCDGLRQVTFPKKLTKIGGQAFRECSKLQVVSFPEGLTTIDSAAFMSCLTLNNVVLPASLTSLAVDTFKDCRSLTGLSIRVENNVYSSFEGVVYDKDRKRIVLVAPGTESIYVSSSVETIDRGALGVGASLCQVEVSTDNQKFVAIENLVYSKDQSKLMHIPGGLTECTPLLGAEIASTAFQKCASLERVIIPNGTTRIEGGVFAENETIKTVVLPDSLVKIESNAFRGCDALECMIIPANVDRLEYGTFEDCWNLTNIVICATNVTISEWCFWQCGLRRVELPPGFTIENFENHPFEFCSSVEEVVVPLNRYRLDEIFPDAQYIRKLTIREGMDEWGWQLDCAVVSEACKGWSGIEEVRFDGEQFEIGYAAFEGCSSIRTVALSADVYIGLQRDAHSGGYESVSGLRDLFPGSAIKCVEFLRGSKSTRYWCSDLTSLEEVILPETLQEIDDHSFMGCANLASVSMPDSVEKIGYASFSGCSSLKVVELPVNLKNIDAYAFNRCSGLSSVGWTDNLMSIGDCAFAGCTSLRGVYLVTDEVVNLSPSAFDGTPIALRLAPGSKNYKIFDGAIFTSDGLTQVGSLGVLVDVIETSIREREPTILDVKYLIRGGYEKVNVRVLAFENGTRSWANVVRPETYIANVDGSESQVGDEMPCNMTNSFAWRVSADFTNNLAKLQVEVFVEPEDLLPLELMQIPAYDGHPSLEFSYNTLTDVNVMNALYWLYADKDAGLTLVNGQLKSGTTRLANGTSVDRENAAGYVFQKMGYERLTDSNYLQYVNAETRLGLSPSGIRQYAVKEVAK